MPVVSKEEIANARKMDLLSYLRAYEPGELVRFSGETYCTRTHDSLKISNGKWYWFSQNIGGRSALDYLVKVKEMSFPEAVKMLNGQAVQPICYEKPPPAPRKLLLPLLDTNTSKTEAYLKSRGIHPQIIAYCIQHGLLFQSENANDVIFVGYDTKGTRRYAALRSMTTDYKGEATGSDKHFSFALVADDRPVREVHVFEAAIDAMSYASLKIMYHKDWRKIAYLSLAGVFASKRANVVPVALEQFLKDHSQITKVVLHLDNDRVGRQAAERVAALIAARGAQNVGFAQHGHDLLQIFFRDLLPLRDVLERDIAVALMRGQIEHHAQGIPAFCRYFHGQSPFKLHTIIITYAY